LWIVNRALDLLAASGDSTAAKIAKAVRAPGCRPAWEVGLHRADDAPYDELNAKGSHFYNGAGRDWTGQPTTIRTYAIGSHEAPIKFESFGDGRGSALSRLAKIVKLSNAGACLDLGFALHYATDLTQPMHSSGLSALNRSAALHPVWESYVPVFQNKYPPAGRWDRRFLPGEADQVLHQISVRSNGFARRLVDVLNPYGVPACSYNPSSGILYSGRCFRGDERVEAITGEILRDAYQSTASFLFAALRTRL
jgi:hypothetical protein